MEICAGLVAIAVQSPPVQSPSAFHPQPRALDLSQTASTSPASISLPSSFAIMVKFYQQLFQQDPQRLQAERYAEFRLPGLLLALFRPQANQQSAFGELTQPPQTDRPLSLCLTVSNLAAAIAQLQTWDCPVGPVAIASHGQEVYVFDPQGNRIILYQPNPAE